MLSVVAMLLFWPTLTDIQCEPRVSPALSLLSQSSQFLNSEVQVLWLPPWSSRLLPPHYLPYVKSSSLPIGPPELVPTKMAKNLPYWIFVTKNSHILTIPVSIQTASHSPHPTPPIPPLQFFSSAQKGKGKIRNPLPGCIFKQRQTSVSCCSKGMWGFF